MKNDICVYTCITGDYDNLREIENMEKGIDYLCFTNNKKIKSKTWKIIYIEDKNLTNTKLARKIKILGNDLINKYKISIWIDGNLYFKKSIHKFLETYALNTDANFISFKHHERNCIYEEINACYQCKKEEKQNLIKIKEFYEKENYPKNNGLVETGVIIRKNGDELVTKTMEMWFEHVLNYSKRDQLSFNYCVYKTKMNVSYMNLNQYNNEWIGNVGHLNLVKRLNYYRLYFGNIETFEMEKCIDGIYEKQNDIYEVMVTIPNDTKQIEFEISEKYNLLLEEYKIEYDKEIKEERYNILNVNNNLFFYDKPVFKLYGNFKKGEKN